MPKTTPPPKPPAPPDSTQPRIGLEGLYTLLCRYQAEARCANELDRPHLLFRAGQELALEEEELLRRGFDKAYRRMVEGV